MKTLVLHPDDRSTDFLKEIYKDTEWTVVTRWDIRPQALKALIESHDRFIAMGHGSPYGLIGFAIFFMDLSIVKLLESKECVFIWCNADRYIERTHIKGFYTGMFISEVGEAKYYGIAVTQEQINESNNLFAKQMKDIIRKTDPRLICETIKNLYVGDTPVYEFNNNRFYYRNGKSVLQMVN